MADYVVDTNVLLVASAAHPFSPFDDCDLPAKARANGAEEPHLYHRARLSRFAERRANAVNSALLERCDLA